MSDQCDPEVYKNGDAIIMMHTIPAKGIEYLVQEIARTSGQKVDWHYVGGRAIVKFIGDRQKVVAAIAGIRSLYKEMMLNEMKKFQFYRPGDELPEIYWFPEDG